MSSTVTSPASTVTVAGKRERRTANPPIADATERAGVRVRDEVTVRTDHDEFLRATMGAMDIVYNLARRFSERPEDAEDLVQETYLAAYRAWRERRRPRRLEPWMATICLNLGRSRYRTRGRRPIEVPIEDRDFRAAAIADPEQAAEAAMDQRAQTWHVRTRRRADSRSRSSGSANGFAPRDGTRAWS
jgi:RNA polymerase sigma factor (sigma-70 family)